MVARLVDLQARVPKLQDFSRTGPLSSAKVAMPQGRLAEMVALNITMIVVETTGVQ